MNGFQRLLWVVAAEACLAASGAAQPRFEPLGLVPDGRNGSINAVSADGRTIASSAISPESQFKCESTGQAFRWTEGVGWDYLDGACGSGGSQANDVSGDGSVLFYSLLATSGPPDFCGLWTEAGGAQQLPKPDGEWTGVNANAISSDGKWAAADWWVNFSFAAPYVWSVDEHTWLRLAPEDGDLHGTVSAIARGGVAAAVQNRYGTTKDSMYMRWTPSGGAVALPLPPGVTVRGPQTFAITSDGSAIIASPIGAFGSLVFWLGDGSRYVVASSGVTLDDAGLRVADDLRIVIGTTFQDGGAFPGLWTPRHGTRRISAVLEAAGVDITGWTLERVSDITPDGKIIVGYGTNPDGQTEGFRIIGRLYCSADCNDDRKLNVNDFLCFQAKWRTQDFYADYNLDGQWNVNDFIAFQADFSKGCP